MKRTGFLLAFALFLIAVLTLNLPGRAYADSTLDATPVEEAQPDDLSVLQRATEKYFDAVETYRDEERKFLIAREQYYQLNTLNAQDEAIRRGQELLRARAAALRTYFQYLNVIVVRTRGIELDDKNRIILALEDADRALSTYEEGIRSLNSREKVDRHFVLLNNLKPDFYNTAYSALAAIKLGEVQTAIDSSTVLSQDLKAVIESTQLSAAEKALRTRGLEEVERLLQRAKNNRQTQRDQFVRNSIGGNYNEGVYNQFRTDIEFSYTQLRQAHSFLKEVTEGL